MDLREAIDWDGVRHPWEIARASLVLALLERQGALPAARVLDVGAGDGYVSARLRAACPSSSCVLVDTGYSDTDRARLRSSGFDAHTRLPPLDGPLFDLALLLDVLEHEDDDVALLRDVARRVRPGGAVLILVPALPALFGPHDRALGHRRRYTRSALLNVARAAGCVHRADGGCFHALVLPRAWEVLRSQFRRASTERPSGLHGLRNGIARRLATRLLAADAALTHALQARGRSLPGLSHWMLLRTP